MLCKILFVEHEAADIAKFAGYLPVDVRDVDLRREVDILVPNYRPKRPELWTPPNTHVVVVNHPRCVEAVLDETFDLVITDVLFDHRMASGVAEIEPGGDAASEIRILFQAVKRVSTTRLKGRSVPIILYTQQGSAVMPIVRQYEHEIADVWDKASSSEFLAWRLHTIAFHMAFGSSGRSLARLVASGVKSAWEAAHVTQMATEYMRSGNEIDQIDAVTLPIRQIASDWKIQSPVDQMWKLFTGWEPLDRAASLAKRAHVRHAVNVFWMGHLLLNAVGLEGLKSKIAFPISQGSASKDAANWDYNSLANLAWFLCGLFHDIGQPGLGVSEILAVQGRSWKPVLVPAATVLGEAKQAFSKAIGDFRLSFCERLTQMIIDAGKSKSIGSSPVGTMLRVFETYLVAHKDLHDDHGLLGACVLAEQLKLLDNPSDTAKAAGVAACIAAAVHNLAGKTGEEPVSWENAPLACLLVVCDQLQAWDREVDELSKKARWHSLPTHAELREFAVMGTDATRKEPHVRISIDYKALPEVASDVVRLNDMKNDLKGVLLDFPVKAIKEGLSDWFFSLDVTFSLEGLDLEVPISIQV